MEKCFCQPCENYYSREKNGDQERKAVDEDGSMILTKNCLDQMLHLYRKSSLVFQSFFPPLPPFDLMTSLQDIFP